MEAVNIKAKLIGYSIGALFILILFLPPVSGLNNLNYNSNDRTIISFDSHLLLIYDVEDTQQVITPIEDTVEIDIFIDYMVIPVDRLLHKLIFTQYEDKTLEIDVEIDNSSLPNFVSASITPNLVSVGISQELTRVKEPVILSVRVDENAPAFVDFTIKIKASAPEVIGRFGFTLIEGATASSEVILSPAYMGLIVFSEPKGNYIEIGPADIVEFPIEITNVGNAPTEVNFEVINIPERWDVDIQEKLILPSSLDGQESSATVVLKVSPPSGFGYHNERQLIKINLTSSYYRDKSLRGSSYILRFSIDLRGGLEQIIVLIIVIIMIIVSIISIIIYRRYKSKSIKVGRV